MSHASLKLEFSLNYVIWISSNDLAMAWRVNFSRRLTLSYAPTGVWLLRYDAAPGYAHDYAYNYAFDFADNYTYNYAYDYVYDYDYDSE